MIPDFDPVTGNLPQGQHPATWEEITERFGTTGRRRDLLPGLQRGLDNLQTVGCRRAWLDGSFAGDKPDPGDFDCCWDTDGVDFVLLQRNFPVLLDFRNKRGAQKYYFGGEFFLADSIADPGTGMVYLEFFQTDKYTGEPKGIILIDLTSWRALTAADVEKETVPHQASGGRRQQPGGI